MVRTGHSQRKKANGWTEVPSRSLPNSSVLRVTELKQVIQRTTECTFVSPAPLLKTVYIVCMEVMFSESRIGFYHVHCWSSESYGILDLLSLYDVDANC